MVKKLTMGVIGLTAVLFAVSSFAASERAMQELYQAAKAEGKVIWHVPGSLQIYQPVVNAFQARYPDIKLSFFSVRSSGIAARIITEANAKNLSFDVASSNPEWMQPLIERGLLDNFDPTKITDVMPKTIIMDGLFHIYEDSALVWVYNNNLVSNKDVPRSWEDLLDPKFKGSKISLRRTATPFAGLYPEWRKNPEKIIQYLRRLKTQEIVWAGRLQEANNRVASGECLLGVFRSNGFEMMSRDGAPIEIAPIGPAIASPTGGMLLKGVRNPNAARLLITWLHSPEGRVALTRVGMSPCAPCDASPFARILCDKGIECVRLNTTQEEVKEYQVFQKAVSQALELSPK